MTRCALPALLVALLGGPALADLPAIGVFRKAIQAQGRLKQTQIKDVYLHIRGHTVDKQGEHGFNREYWYRAKDKSLRVRTQSKAANRARTDRGYLGGKGYWELTNRGTLLKLKKANRDDEEVIETIRRDRRDFTRIYETVLLSRLDDKDTELSFGTPEPVSLENDLPYSANAILGKDRKANKYYVLDVKRPGEDPLRLFIHTRNFQVHKVVEYSADGAIDWVYYFGPFHFDEDLALWMPRYFSAHEKAEPVNKQTRKDTGRYRGEVSLKLNSGLKTSDVFPGGK